MGVHVKSSEAAEETRVVLDSIRRLVQGLRVAARGAESELGLSGAQLFVLQKLGEEPRMSVNDLAERTFTHQSSVSVVVQRLVDKGLVRRDASEADRRRVELSLTPAGRKLLSRSPLASQERMIGAVTAMPPAARRQLAQRLAELVAAMGLDGEPVAMLFEGETKKPEGKATKRAARTDSNGSEG
jgi:DNA-binding MarR family transcriptional regulator